MEKQVTSAAVPDIEKVDLLSQVTDGMLVYDLAGKKVGAVHGIFGGTSGSAQPAQIVIVAGLAPVGSPQQVPILEPVPAPARVPVFDESFETDDNMPRELRERLEHDGFLRIDAGVLKHHRFALRGQIERVADGVVVLNVLAGELIKH